MPDATRLLPYHGKPRRIILYGNPLLRTVTTPVEEITSDILQLAADLKASLDSNEGIGLAANQIGTALSIFVLAPWQADVDLPLTFIINPEIIITEGAVEAEEGCLSLPGIFEIVKRPEMVIIKGVNLAGKETRLQTSGLLARAVIHEIEHLQGKLFIDHISELRLRFLQTRLKEIEKLEQQRCV